MMAIFEANVVGKKSSISLLTPLNQTYSTVDGSKLSRVTHLCEHKPPLPRSKQAISNSLGTVLLSMKRYQRTPRCTVHRSTKPRSKTPSGSSLLPPKHSASRPQSRVAARRPTPNRNRKQKRANRPFSSCSAIQLGERRRGLMSRSQ